jgi:mono/diheme cytochrome c family protein
LSAVVVPSALSTTQSTPKLPALKLKGNVKRGKNVFQNVAHCEVCHTLRDAGATGHVGPNLDRKKPTFAVVVKFVTLGAGHGDCCSMPSFSKARNPYGQYPLTNQQIADVAKYVSTVAGR